MPLTDPPTTRTSAVVESFWVKNRRYISRYADCGKKNCKRCGGAGRRTPSHGPYWYLCVTIDGHWEQIYLGKDLDTKRYVTDQGNVDMIAIAARPRRPTTPREFAESPVPPPPDPPAPAAPAPPALEAIPAYDPEYADRLPSPSTQNTPDGPLLPPLPRPDPSDPGPVPQKSP